MGLKTIAVFDFDGTIIKDDSLILFLKKYFNFSPVNFPALLKLFIYAVKFFLKIYSQKQIKEKLINLVLKSLKIEGTACIHEDFSLYLETQILDDARNEILRLGSLGFKTILLSASVDIYLRKIYKKIGFSGLICTRTKIEDGRLFIDGDNCFGEKKIERLLESYKKESVDWLNSYCFSDNMTDLKLLEMFGNSFIVNNKKILKYSKKDIGFLKWD